MFNVLRSARTARICVRPAGVRCYGKEAFNPFVKEAEIARQRALEATKLRSLQGKQLPHNVTLGQPKTNARDDENSVENRWARHELRAAPANPLQYTGRGSHEATMETVNRIRRQYEYLPRNREQEGPRWVSRGAYVGMIGSSEPVSSPQHSELTKALSDLYYIDSQLKPQVVRDLLRRFLRGAAAGASEGEVPALDAKGRAVTRGRRKTASARVILTKAEDGKAGQILVNGLPISQYFTNLDDRAEAMFPLAVVQSETKYNVFATAVGGGNSGKAGAIALGVARGVIIHNPLLRKRLSKAGCLTRDARTKERKKPGLRRARAAPTWVKR